MLGVAIGGIVFELRPISIGFVITFASLIGLLAAAAVLLVDLASMNITEDQGGYSDHPFTEGAVRGLLAVAVSVFLCGYSRLDHQLLVCESRVIWNATSTKPFQAESVIYEEDGYGHYRQHRGHS